MEYTPESIDRRIAQFEDVLIDNHINSDDIGALMQCRDLIVAEMAYFGKLAADSLVRMKIQDAYYRQKRSRIILTEKAVNKGEVKASEATPKIKMDFIISEGLNIRVKHHLRYLDTQDDIIKQKLSHLKKLWELSKFQNR